MSQKDPFQEKLYRNNHGLIEIYGMSEDPEEHGYHRRNAQRIGLYIQQKPADGGPMRTAALPISPQLAREIARDLQAWADQISPE